MSQSSEMEIKALDEAWLMLRFAALKEPSLDNALIEALRKAQEAKDNAQPWDMLTSNGFWQAYTKLSTLIQPVNVDCLAVAQRNRKARKLYCPWKPAEDRSLGEQCSSYYSRGICFLIVITAVLQFLLSIYGNYVADIDSREKSLLANLTALTSEYAGLNSETVNLGTQPWTQAQTAQATQVTEDSKNLIAQSNQIFKEVHEVNTIFAFGQAGSLVHMGVTVAKPQWYDYYDTAREVASEAAGAANDTDNGSKNFFTAFSLFLLPIFYAAIGANAYIIRLISYQLKTTTFSSTSPIRHWVRFCLGVMMGLVISMFSGLTQTSNLSPLALAFLAGYGVEAFLALFDELIGRITKPPEPAAAPAGDH